MIRVLAALLGVISLAATARADRACSSDDVRSRARELLGRDAFATTKIDLAADGREGHITLDDGATRTVSAQDCAGLVEAMALVLVMTAHGDEAPDPAPAAAPEPPMVAPEPLVRWARAVPPPPRGVNETAFIVRGGVGMTAGDLDGLGAVAARVRRAGRSLELQASMQTTDDVTIGSGHVTVGLTAFTAAGCVYPRAFAVCATATAGWWTGRGEQLVDASTRRLPFLAVGARAGWERAVSDRVSLGIELGFDVPTRKSRFLVDQMPIWTSPRFAATGGVAAIVQIP